MVSRKPILVFIAGLLFVAILAAQSPGGLSALASPAGQTESTPEPTAIPNLSIADEYCLSCHAQPGLSMELENGEELGLYVPPEYHNESVHGELGYACVQCHTEVGPYPHPEYTAEDRRAVTLELNQVCMRCHELQFSLTQDSVHAAALAGGNRAAAVCVDCHTAHAVRRLKDPETDELTQSSRVWVPQTCARCHFAIYQQYEESVHGAALLDEGNMDVPTCIDCHGVHDIADPTTAAFRLQSPNICAECHTDPEVMDKYGLSTLVLDTYVADFHGTTVTLFERQHPDQETNKPVCFDCHGVHDIRSTSDPEKGLQVRENILERCQVCHPGAAANFPDAWLSHYIPSPDRYPVVFTVEFFYSLFIPGVLGGMAILVILDMASVARKSVFRRRKEPASEDRPPVETPEPTAVETPADPGSEPMDETPARPDEGKRPGTPPEESPATSGPRSTPEESRPPERPAESQAPLEPPEENRAERGAENELNSDEDEESAHG